MKTLYLRYNDLAAKGVVNNRPTLYRWIKRYGFPKGQLLGPNTRAWRIDEVEEWLRSRPVAIGQSGLGLKRGHRDG
jgi:predicted DNA-binding transcriptional regulator AlpA